MGTTTPRPPHALPPPLPQDSTIPPGLRGRGLRPPPPPRRLAPLSPAPARPAQPPALTAPTAPAAPPCPGFSPTHSRQRRRRPDPSRAGSGGSGTHDRDFAPGTETALRSAPSPPWGLSRLWEDCISLCPLVLGGSPGFANPSQGLQMILLSSSPATLCRGTRLWGCGGSALHSCPCSGGVWGNSFFFFLFQLFCSF